MLDITGQSQPPQEVRQVVRQGEQLKTDLIVEITNGIPCAGTIMLLAGALFRPIKGPLRFLRGFTESNFEGPGVIAR